MPNYESNTNSHAGNPLLLGVTGDACATCNSSDVTLYDLSCHDSDDFYCRDCLTKMWYAASDEVVRCPACGNDCDFKPLPSIEEFHISRNFRDDEVIDKIREQPEIMNNLIGFTAREATVLLQHTYDLVEDQILDPAELGGVRTSLNPLDPELTLDQSYARNMFYSSLIREIAAVPKMMTEPLQLEEDLMSLLDATTKDHIKFFHENDMAAAGVGVEDDELAMHQAIPSTCNVKKVRENWIEIVKIWVVLLAWRHIERTAPAEGGAAERFRQPMSLS